MAKCKALTRSAVKGLMSHLTHNRSFRRRVGTDNQKQRNKAPHTL